MVTYIQQVYRLGVVDIGAVNATELINNIPHVLFYKMVSSSFKLTPAIKCNWTICSKMLLCLVKKIDMVYFI